MITKDSRNILVADDSLFFRTRLSDILMEAGLTTTLQAKTAVKANRCVPFKSTD